ncbi:MAG TPA: translation initiation factor IF-2 [Acidobacteriota bacterium]|nr:translation initiation factor IF-2 [Acidobacteriota bacterium]
MTIRSPICVVVGHVDHGKSSVLDYIRSSNIVAHEAGAITQAIGASIIPISAIKEKCGNLLAAMKLNFTIPGLLFIDTPGHAAFTSLRHRGGNLADIAILVIDINEGFKPQTIESLKILKEYKTPFIVAANKIDLIQGYKTSKQTTNKSVLGNVAALGEQNPQFLTTFETKMYTLVQNLYENGFPAERFDRVADFTKEVGIVPVSAMHGDGMAELLMVLSALAQKYLEASLHTTANGPAKGTILEVKDQKGLGIVLDVILYDGTLNTNDTIVIGGMETPIVTKVRALLTPEECEDMRHSKCKYGTIKSAVAATGVRISAPGIETAMSGMPIQSATPATLEKTKQDIQSEIQKITLETQESGIVVKADTIGSLEALLYLLKEAQIPVRVASVGQITKKDILEAVSNVSTEPLYGCILGFNIKPTSEVVPKDIKIITAPVIYHLLDTYAEWKNQKEREKKTAQLATLPRLAKFQFLEGCSFRASNPAVCGAHVLLGELVPGMSLIKADGSVCGHVKSLQENKESISSAKKGMQVACAIEGVTIGRQIAEKDTFYSRINEEEFLQFKKHIDLVDEEGKQVLREIADIMRKSNPAWGIG